MTKEYIQWLERMINGCDQLGGMGREKAAYQNCLKKAREQGENLGLFGVMPLLSEIDERLNDPHSLGDFELGRAAKIVKKCEQIAKDHATYPIMYNEA